MLQNSLIKDQKSAKLASVAALGLIAGLILSLSQSAQAQQGDSQLFGGEILRQHPDMSNTGRYYYPNRLLVTFKKGVVGADVIRQITAERQESAGDNADLQVQLDQTRDFLGLVTVQPPRAEKERFGPQPYMILEDENKESNGSDDWLLSRLKRSDKVERVTRDYVLFAHDTNTDLINEMLSGGADKPAKARVLYPNDRFFKHQWHLKLNGAKHDSNNSPGASNFPLIWAKQSTRIPPIIAVIDTGMYYDHEDIKGNKRILPGYDFISNKRTAKDGDGIDNDATDPGTGSEPKTCASRSSESDSWHGTHVAGLAGALGSNNRIGATGGAWNARIVPVRVLGRCGSGSVFDIMRAMLWAGGIPLNGVPDNLNPANIINLSLGARGQCNKIMQRVVDLLNKRGVTVIASAGNDGADAAGALPANCKGVITVAASDARGHIAPYSNFGSKIDLMASGGDLTRDDNGDRFADGMLSAVKGGYKFYQGTSQAAPMVAAAAALIKTLNPSFGPDQILKSLKGAALSRSDRQCAKGCGSGLLNMAPLIKNR